MATSPARMALREMLRQLERYAGLRPPYPHAPGRPATPQHRGINWQGRQLRPQRPPAERIAAAAAANEQIAALVQSPDGAKQAPE